MTVVLHRIRAQPWAVAWIALGLVTLLVVVGDAFGVFAPDTKPELYANPGLLLHRSLYVWQPDPHLGQMNYNTGILPVAAVLTVVRAVGVEAWLAQRLFMVALLLVGAAGAARLVTELTGRRGAGPWLAGLVHAWHPWTVVGANNLPVRLPHAVLPWVLLTTHRALRSGTWRDAAVAGLAYGAMAGINGGVVNLMYVLPVLLLAGWAVGVRATTAGAAAATLVRIGVVAVGLSAYWLVPSLLATGSSAGDVLLNTEDPVGLARLGSPTEVLRGMGMWTNYVVIDGQIENAQQLAFLTSPVVVVAGFLLTAAALVAVLGVPRRVQLLVGGLVAVGTSVLLGINGAGGASPVGRALAWLFEAVPAATAFRTTNKAGSFLVLGLALALGAGVTSPRLRRDWGVTPATATAGVVAVVAVAAGPVAAGGLHPNQYPVPDYWYVAAAATDEPSDDRLLLLPGSAAVRYLWGHRGVDDLDAALWADRHVLWRSTIPAGSAPAANLLSAFGTGLELDRFGPGSLTTHTRLLGAGTALVRGDTDWRRNFGRSTADLRADVLGADGTALVTTFGPAARAQGFSPSDAPPDLPAVTEVALPATAVAQAWTLDDPLVVVGDAFAVDQLVRAGTDPASRPMLYLDDLDDDQLATVLDAGGEVVLTDTNHRRSWTIGSLTDSYTPLLAADDDVPDTEQRARTTDPAHQTVRSDEGPVVTASGDPYALLRRRAAGQPALANDGDLSTGWQYGTATDSRDGWVQLEATRPGRVDSVSVVVATGGKAIERVTIEVGGTSRDVPVVDGVATADRIGEVTDRVRVTITDTSGDPLVPATVNELVVLGDADAWGPTRLGARLPTTLTDRAAVVPELTEALADAPLRLLLSRLHGHPDDPFDDEEATLRRSLELPFPARFDPAATVATARRVTPWPAGECTVVATVTAPDGTVHDVRGRATVPAAAGAPVRVTGCGDPVDVPGGVLRVENAPFVTVDHLALGTAPVTGGSHDVPVATTVRGAADDDPTRAELELPTPADEPVLVSSGQAWHPGWRAETDGRDLGPPLVAGGYAAGWIVPAGTERVTVTFAPQGPTRLAQWCSAATLAVAAAVALRRRRDQ